MNKITTPRQSFEAFEYEEKTSSRKRVSPSVKTLNFLKSFARNYRASKALPESLQGFVLG